MLLVVARAGRVKSTIRIEQLGGIAAVSLVIIGCGIVLRPFVSALLWAAIVCYSTWPLFSLLERWLKGRRMLTSLLMTLLVAIVMVVPFLVVGLTLVDNITELSVFIDRLRENGLPPPPSWIERIPLFGVALDANWRALAADSDRTIGLVNGLFLKSQHWLLTNSIHIAQGVLQLVLSVLIAFFFYRDGELVVDQVSRVMTRLAGDYTQHLTETVGRTIKGVVYGILGTAIAQGVVAAIGFKIAGVPSPLLLGLITFFLSLIPAGPPLVWVPAVAWLFFSDHVGWAVFMLIWGTFGISGIDNLVRPYLISRGANLPFVMILLGVTGGILAFGFLGVFLGPTLLAVGYVLLREWIKTRKTQHLPPE